MLFTRAEPLGIVLEVGDFRKVSASEKWFGAIVQYPNSDGVIEPYAGFTEKVQSIGAKIAVAADLLSLALLTPPGEWGADIVFGSTQRYGVPMGYGGPSAAFFSTREEYKRDLPVGSLEYLKTSTENLPCDSHSRPASSTSKREKATTNICTSQGLLATYGRNVRRLPRSGGYP